MGYTGLEDFTARGKAVLAKGPAALIFAEDGVELESTVRHHAEAGFRAVVLFAPADLALPEGLAETAEVVRYDTLAEDAVPRAVTAAIAAAPEGTWLYYCYNAEYLFFPFSETRNVRELLAFHSEERRAAMLSYVIDLYAGDLGRFPNAVSLEEAFLDRSGYYAAARKGPPPDFAPKDRQLDFYGGLRWRFEEHVPYARRKIDRIGLFRASRGLWLRADHTLSDEELNTFSCPWHHNLTAAICSFRTAKALRANPGSRQTIASFKWHNSVPFEWRAQQLLDLGLIEPGQWF
jgi:hypothetical protein